MSTLFLLVRAIYIWVLFFAHIPFVVNRTLNATPTERLQQAQCVETEAKQRNKFILSTLAAVIHTNIGNAASNRQKVVHRCSRSTRFGSLVVHKTYEKQFLTTQNKGNIIKYPQAMIKKADSETAHQR